MSEKNRAQRSQQLQDTVDQLVQVTATTFLAIGSLWAQFGLPSDFGTSTILVSWFVLHAISFLALRTNAYRRTLIVLGFSALNLYFFGVTQVVAAASNYRFPVGPQFFLVSALSILAWRRRHELQTLLVTALAWVAVLAWTRPSGGGGFFESQGLSLVGIGLQFCFLGVCWLIRERFRASIRDTIRDLGARPDLDPERIQASKMQALGELLASVVHEISNPLTSIKGYNHQVEEELREAAPDLKLLGLCAERIRFNVDRIMSIARALRNFSRDSSRDSRVEITLAGIFEDTLVLMAHPLKAAGIELNVERPPESLRVRANPVELSQVLVNLLANARDACEGRPRRLVRMGTTVTAERVSVWVEDTGGGVSDEAAPHLFKPFYTTKRLGKGTGLGLYISHLIAERHETRIAYETLRDRTGQIEGTRFSMELPLVVGGIGSGDAERDGAAA